MGALQVDDALSGKNLRLVLVLSSALEYVLNVAFLAFCRLQNLEFKCLRPGSRAQPGNCSFCATILAHYLLLD